MKTKKWYKSLTYWGAAILSLCGVILPALGEVNLANFLQGEQTGILEWLTALGDLVGSALIVYGRWRATTKITR